MQVHRFLFNNYHQMSICRCSAASITIYLSIYLSIYIYIYVYIYMYIYIYVRRWGSTSKTKRRQVDLCKCKVADANVQVEINFAKAPTTSKKNSIFSEGCRAAWIDVHETQPSRTKCRSSKTEVKLQCGFEPGQPFPTKCVSILENCRKCNFA